MTTDRETVPGRQVSVDEAMEIAILLQRNGHLAAAGDVLRQVLEAFPDNARAVHYSGVLAHQQGRSDEALVFIERSLELQPDEPDWLSNLGVVLRELGRLDPAMEACRRAIRLAPNHANAHNNLGGVLRALKRDDEAEDAYRTAIALNPAHTDAYTNLGNLLAGQKRLRDAVECFCKVITLDPKHAEGRRLLALAHTVLGEVDKAVEIYEQWIAAEPDNPIPRHMLAAVSERDVPARASDAFIERTFDSFASTFESRLAALSYRAPTLVADALAESGLAASGSLDVLDAGCGTGLCGRLVAPYARRLAGVDLSANMLAKARETGQYHELVRSELTAYLRGSHGTFDVIVSADTLVYFGALDEVLGAAAEALRPGGVLIFTVEELAAGEPAAYRIQPHGRFAHAAEYVERLLYTAGLRPVIGRAHLRVESGLPVAGLVVRATKTAGDLDG
ncbi:MAG: tetratricopeptide repeat protein [Vicinamibacterales bacterium]